jgi:biotin-(acetyl-CoA carboxylase) ligase
VAGKKLAGVIAESVYGPVAHERDQSNDPGPDCESQDQNAAEHVLAVIGIGLNVNFNLTGYEGTMPDPTSISAELGGQVDRVVVLKRLLRSLDGHYSELSAGGTIVPAWRAKLTTLGKMVTITSGSPGGSTKMHGLAHDVDSIGRLIVRDADGRNWPVSAGEATLQDTS